MEKLSTAVYLVRNKPTNRPQINNQSCVQTRVFEDELLGNRAETIFQRYHNCTHVSGDIIQCGISFAVLNVCIKNNTNGNTLTIIRNTGTSSLSRLPHSLSAQLTILLTSHRDHELPSSCILPGVALPSLVQYQKEIAPKIPRGKRRQKGGIVVQELKAVGSNPLHFGLRIQQLVQWYCCERAIYLEKKSKDTQDNGDRKEVFPSSSILLVTELRDHKCNI